MLQCGNSLVARRSERIKRVEAVGANMLMMASDGALATYVWVRQPFVEREGLWQAIDKATIRALDIVVALMLLLILLPTLLTIAAAIYVTDPGPVIFAHKRIGQGGQLFPCLKFRSMIVDADARLRDLLARDPLARAEWGRDHKLRNDPRITALGRFLRKSSIDELPQLWNVLRGEMSLVGPRPIVQAEIERYRGFFAHYVAVKPGMTGLWQISGRNDVSYNRRVALDVSYSRSRSFLFNLKILLMTTRVVCARSGSY
jgi:lipopolysaccharide/colanic/teichoic acid biosynthesis glycosyltransferase